ncbi:MAG: acetylxylan esterase [Bacteroidales bacterium]|nr:acetylxylan esterase [Candidatus Cryptobacteroides aphodequi]
MKRTIIAVLALLLSGINAGAAIQLPQSGPSLKSDAFSEYMENLQKDALKRRDANCSLAETSPAAMQDYVALCRKKFATLVGELPEPGELKAVVTGTEQGSCWRVDKVVYQSIPGRYVTALLFIPDEASIDNPAPCVVHTCGHTEFGKRSYAAAASYLADNGIACIVVDPFGQGERVQEIDAQNKSLTRGPTTEHGIENFGCILTGTPLFARILQDNMRAIDYLQTRPEIDCSRIGAVGTSGAGVQTLLFTAYDTRVKAAVMSSSIAWGFAGTGLDGCGLIPGIAARGMSLTDIAMTIAPRPIQYMNGQKDYVKIDDGRRAIAQIRRSYALQGASEADVRMIEVPTAHPYYVPGKQEGMIRFFCETLLGRKDVDWTFPGDVDGSGKSEKKFPSPKFNCTAAGQVLGEYADAKSLYEENLEFFDSHAADRKKFVSGPIEAIYDKVCSLTGYVESEEDVNAVLTADARYDGYSFKAYRLERAGQVPVPCSVIVPDNIKPDAPVKIWLYDGGMDELLRSPSHIKLALEAGGPVLIADLRGFGQTKKPSFISGNFKSWNDEYPEFTGSMFLGTTLLGQRIGDIVTILDFCSETSGLRGRKINVVASGDYTPVAVHAAFLDDRISDTLLMHGVKTWRFCLNPIQRDVCGMIVPGVLKFYDLPDLARLAGGSVRYSD